MLLINNTSHIKIKKYNSTANRRFQTCNIVYCVCDLISFINIFAAQSETSFSLVMCYTLLSCIQFYDSAPLLPLKGLSGRFIITSLPTIYQ